MVDWGTGWDLKIKRNYYVRVHVASKLGVLAFARAFRRVDICLNKQLHRGGRG